ncbi:uncharacterized protein LOC129309767 isoform X2 [Prosopis cineraria]|uniref:uncharacterized protein LOC129309767 isoform X2 n=1 Tax=Prosopis cineraria TaxID=364024 RepID=UPI00240FF581|nr:uncharacterized protein LOC129309767 isoform X2 [Prosopis cineraria]
MITSHDVVSRHMSFCAPIPLSDLPMKGRKAPPTHSLFKIKSFSLLSNASVEEYTSEEFEAGGYQWTLSIYPTGSKKKGAQFDASQYKFDIAEGCWARKSDHISVYLNLMLSSSKSLPIGWEVNAIVNLFVYNFLRDEYCSHQDANVRRFHKLQTEWGIPKFMDLASFKDPSNGFLIEDTCAFGAEILVMKPPSKEEFLTMIDEPVPLSYRWKFDNFSKANLEKYESEFLAGNYKWKLIFYPNGLLEGKGNNISTIFECQHLINST